MTSPPSSAPILFALAALAALNACSDREPVEFDDEDRRQQISQEVTSVEEAADEGINTIYEALDAARHRVDDAVDEAKEFNDD